MNLHLSSLFLHSRCVCICELYSLLSVPHWFVSTVCLYSLSSSWWHRVMINEDDAMLRQHASSFPLLTLALTLSLFNRYTILSA